MCLCWSHLSWWAGCWLVAARCRSRRSRSSCPGHSPPESRWSERWKPPAPPGAPGLSCREREHKWKDAWMLVEVDLSQTTHFTLLVVIWCIANKKILIQGYCFSKNKRMSKQKPLTNDKNIVLNLIYLLICQGSNVCVCLLSSSERQCANKINQRRKLSDC